MNKRKTKDDSGHFTSLADMMTVLMMIFMLIAIVTIQSINEKNVALENAVKISFRKNEMIREVVVVYQETQQNLYNDLYEEFKQDLDKWNAYINQKTLSITFESPEILFHSGKSHLREEFKTILMDFFPRYIQVMESGYKDEIEEIRIEGYTDSDGIKGNSHTENYFYNMELSQNRTRRVLEFCMKLPLVQEKFNWMSEYITANGLSSSKLKYTNGVENKEKSRRVEFRVKTKSDTKLRQIIERLN